VTNANQLGRRNIADIDKIALAMEREEILARKAKANAGTRTDLLAELPTGASIPTRAACAKAAGVGERQRAAGGTVPQKSAEAPVETRDALVTWQGIVLDGHNRLAICRKHGLTYNTTGIDLPDRDAAMI